MAIGLGNTNSAPQHSDKNQAQNTAKFQLKFISDNWGAFCKVANKKDISATINFKQMVIDNEPFFGKQTSYIDGLYEKCWRGIDNSRSDNKFGSYKGIKFGKHVRIPKPGK